MATRASLDYTVNRALSGSIKGSPTGKTLTGVRDLKDMLESKHPVYKACEKSWQDYVNLYLSDKIEQYIFRHMREKETYWNRRKERAYFFNYVQSIIDLIGSFIYSKSIQRQWESPQEREFRIRQLRSQYSLEDYQNQQASDQQASDNQQSLMNKYPEAAPKLAQQQQQAPAEPAQLPDAVIEDRVSQILDESNNDPAELQEFWRDIDKRGTSIDDFSKLLHICTQIWGQIDVFVDMDSVPDDQPIVSEKDRKDRGIRPYCFVIFPMDLLNWEIGPDGRFEWIRWREELTGNIGPWDKRSEKKSYKYFTWTREDWVIHSIIYTSENSQAEIAEIGHGVNELGEIPIVRFFNKKHLVEPMLGISAIKDIAKINVEVLNICSLLDEEVYQKMLNTLVMQNPTEKKGAVEIGSNNVLLWEGEGQPPFYLAPSSEPGTFMMELIKLCISEIYRLAKLGGDTGVLAKEAQSGVAYNWEFNQTNRMLSDKADMMERGEIEVHRLWAKYLGTEWQGIIDYPDDFNVESFTDEVKNIIEVKGAVRSPEFKRIMERRMAFRAMAKVPSEQRARVAAEIDVMQEEKQQSFYPPF